MLNLLSKAAAAQLGMVELASEPGRRRDAVARGKAPCLDANS